MTQQHHAPKKEKSWKPRPKGPDSPGGFVWFTGFIGAFVFYVEQVDNFGAGVVAFLKALVWPAFLVYNLLG
jgi:hypothetical protein